MGIVSTIQFGANSPITLTGISGATTNLKNIGGYASITRSFNGRFGRMGLDNSVGLTGTALTDAQAWIAGGA